MLPPTPPPSAARAVGAMLIPAAVLTLLVVGYVVSHGGAVEEASLRRVLPALIAVGHTVSLVALVLMLRSEGRTLADAGWRRGSAKVGRDTGGASPGRELVIGVVAGVALYVFKELVLDSVEAVLAGRRPTFTSLFRFRAPVGEGALLMVATTFVLVEETIYRGYGLPALVARWGVVPGLVSMGLLFGLLHWGNGPLAILFTAVLGMAFGGMSLWRGWLPAAAAAHVVYNAMVILT